MDSDDIAAEANMSTANVKGQSPGQSQNVINSAKGTL